MSALALALVFAAPLQDVDGRFGEYLSTLDELQEPTRAEVSTSGEVWVTESWAHRVVVFSPEGELVAAIGSHGGGAGELRTPLGLDLVEAEAAVDARLYVADSGNHRVVVFDGSGEAVGVLGASREDGLRLDRPSDVVVGGDAVYVADSGNHRVVVFETDGTFRHAFGGLGGESGELRHPTGLALDERGRLFVADSGNHRIAVFEGDGTPLFTFGDRGPYPGLFSEPADVDVFGERVYVADRGNHRVQVFDLEAEPLYEWGIHVVRPREGEGRLHYPGGIAIAPDGSRAVVCEAFSDRVQVFGPAEGPAESYMTDPALFSQGPARHLGMELDAAADTLVVAEPETESVLVYAVVDATPLLMTTLGGLGPLADDLLRVGGVALGRDGLEIVATDAGTRKICRYRLERPASAELRRDERLGRFVDGVLLDRIPGGRSFEPGAVARGPEGDLFVADRSTSSVVQLSSDYRVLAEFGGEGAGPGRLRAPTDLAWDRRRGELWVVDSGNARLCVFDGEGEFLRAVGSGGALERPHGLALTATEVYVTDAARHRIAVFGREGGLRRTFGRRGLGAGEFFKPRGIAVDSAGRLVVLDHGNHRGQFFSPEEEFVSAFGARLYVKETRVGSQP